MQPLPDIMGKSRSWVTYTSTPVLTWLTWRLRCTKPIRDINPLLAVWTSFKEHGSIG
jgi:hypothetical protein